MKHATSSSIKEQVMQYCARTAHPFPNRVYRKIKKLYLATPRHLRHRFSVAKGGII